MVLLNRLPEWDEILECLVLKFQGNRIRFPSARNILLYEEHEMNRKKKYKKECEISSPLLSPRLTNSVCLPTPFSLSASISVSSEDAIFQFGKSLPEEYVLDFRFPLSPLQSFAIALSTYSFTSRSGSISSSAPGSRSGSGSGSSLFAQTHHRQHYQDAQNPKP
jgi:hypothetical protein